MMNTTISNRVKCRAGTPRQKPVIASFVNLSESIRCGATMALLLMAQAASADTYVVTTAADPGLPGFVSLRDAITVANANPGPDVIEFALPPGLWTINLLSDLPAITDPVTIDALTQPGSDGVPVVELTTGVAKNGLVIKAGGSIVRGLVINEFREYAIVLQNNGHNTISNNFVGTDVAGTLALGNGAGILISQSDSNVIGGAVPGAGNLISGNYGSGIEIRSSSGNQVQGNFIGTEVDGRGALGNGTGILIDRGSDANVIGGPGRGAGNLISGNTASGIEIRSASGNRVEGNLIGTSVDGLVFLGNDTGLFLIGSRNTVIGGAGEGAGNVISGNTDRGVLLWQDVVATRIQGNIIGLDAAGGYPPLPNGSAGVELTSGPHDTLIGGPEPAARNIISGNFGSGVFITGFATVNNVVQGNFIGTDSSGTVPIGNQFDGVEVSHAASANLIGGAAAGAGNVIAYNYRDGVGVIFPASVGNTIVGNSIFSNVRLGINLAGSPEDAFGVSFNDLGDLDGGPNNLQNFPGILFFRTTAAGTTVRGSLNSQPGREYHIDVYQSTAKDPSDHGEGQFYVGRTNVTTDGFGNADFAVFVSAKYPGEFFTATATDAVTGDTSEFSPVALAVDAHNFNDGLIPPGSGFPGAGNAGRIADDGTGRNGVVHLTDANQGGAFGVFSIPAPAGGSNLNNLHLHWRSLVGGDNGSVCGASQFNRPGAHGYSMSWGADLPNPPSYGNPGEEGAGSGLIVTVDTFDNGNGEAPGLEIKWRGARVAFDNLNADPGLAKDFLRKGVFVDADLTVDAAGHATFTYDGRVLTATMIDWGGIAGGGCIMFGARSGGACDNHWIDDLLIEKFLGPTNPARTFAGLPFSPIGSATTTVGSDRLDIGNLGPGGLDGVRIELGRSEGWRGSFRTLDLSPANTILHMVARENVSGPVERIVGRFRMYCSSNSAVGLAADFSAIASMKSTIQVRDRLGVVVSYFSVPNDTAITFRPVNPADAPMPCLTSFVLEGERPTVWCRLCRPVSVLAPEPGGAGLAPIELASYCIFPMGPFAPVQSISSIELKGQGLVSFSLDDEALRMNGLFHHTPGSPPPGGSPQPWIHGECAGHSNVSPPCSPSAIRFDWFDPGCGLCPSPRLETVLDLVRSYYTAIATGGGPAVATQPGAYLRLLASGNLGGLSVALGELRMTKRTADWTLTADFTPAGPTSQRVELYHRGTQVAGFTGRSGSLASMPMLPDGYCGTGSPDPILWPVPPSSDPSFLAKWLEPQPILIPGVAGQSVTIMADEIRVVAENPTAPLRSLESFAIETAGIPSFSLSNERTQPSVLAPLQIIRQANGVLIIIQTEVNRTYKLEYNGVLEDGGPPWEARPHPWTVLQTIQGDGMIQTVLDPSDNGGIPGGDRRFYQLRTPVGNGIR